MILGPPNGNQGIRHRSRKYDSRKSLVRLFIAIVVIFGLLFFSVQIGLVGVVAESIEDSMYTPPTSTTEPSARYHTNSDEDWRLSLNRSLDAEYTDNPTTEPIKIQTTQLEVMEFVNAQRTNRGIEPLFWNRDLSQLNRWYAREIYQMGGGNSSHFNQETGRFIDDRAKWAGYPIDRCARYGEVVSTSLYLRGFERVEKNAAAITEGWMRSDSHREGILNEQYDVAGVGIFVAGDDTRIAVMTLCDRADIPDEELNGWEDAKYRGDRVAIPYEVAVAGDEWDSTGNLTETPRSTDADTASA
jgi:uncharacterized protein YkwD